MSLNHIASANRPSTSALAPVLLALLAAPFSASVTAAESVPIAAYLAQGDWVLSASDGNIDDNLVLRFDGTRYWISSTSAAIFDAPGLAGDRTSTVSVLAADIAADRIVINGGGGNDLLTIDLGDGRHPILKQIVYYGGDQAGAPGDALALTGSGVVDTANYYFDNEHDGSIELSGQGLIRYFGLEPITSTISAANVSLNYSNAAQTITISDPGADQTQVDSTAGEIVTFNNPTSQLRITGGVAGDTFEINSLTANYPARLLINPTAVGGFEPGANDTLNINGTVSFAADRSTFLRASTINQTGSISGAISITLVADTLALSAAISTAPIGRVGIETFSAARPISLGIESLGSLSLQQSEIDLISAAELEIGFIASGELVIGSSVSTAVPILRLESGLGIIGGPGPGTDLTVDGLRLSSRSGIGTSLNPLETQVASLVADAGSPGLPGDIFINNSGALLLGTPLNDGSSGASGTTINIVANGSLTVGGDTRATGNMTLTAVDTAASGDDLTINANLFIRSDTGTITLNAGDDLNATTARLTAPLGIAINADQAIDPDVGTGSTVNLGGILTTSASACALTINGGNDADAFNITPSSTTEICVNGGSPISFPGDTLDYNGAGATGVSFAGMIPGDGSISANNRRDLNFTSIEFLVDSVDLAVTKSDGVATAVPGSAVMYTVVVSNAGPTTAVDATFADSFAAAISSATWTSVPAGGASGNTAMGAGDIAETLTLPAGSSVTYTVTANITASATGSLANTATATPVAPNIDLDSSNNSATDTDMLTPQADLMISKDDGVATAVPGESVTYVIGVSNTGPSDAPGSTVTDNFPAACSSVTWTCAGVAGGTCAAGGGGNIAEVVNLPAGASVNFTAVCGIDSMATGTLDNMAEVLPPAGTTDTNPANDSATDSDTLTPVVDLAVSKDDGVTIAVPGESVTYVLGVSNAGPSDGVGSSVTDNFPAACTSVSWTCTGSAGGSCAASGSGNLSELVDVPVGGSVSFSAVCTIDPAATGTLVNTASAAPAAGTIDTNPANDSATDTDTLTPEVDLAISKDDGLTTAIPGESVTYVIGVSNTGPSAAFGASVDDAFPAFCTGVSWTCIGSDGGICSASGSGSILEMVDLPVGASVSYTAVCSIDSAATGTLTNTATVTAAAGSTDTNPANDSATDSDNLTPEVDLAISKDDGVSTAIPGESVTYVIGVGNAGPSAAVGASVADSFPAFCTGVSWTCVASAGGICSASGSGNITEVVDLPVGASVSYSALCNIAAAATGTLDNTATVTPAAGTTDTNPANDSATDSDTLTPEFDLAVSKDDGVSTAIPGQSVTYAIGISNPGPSDAVGASVSDSFPAFCTGVSWTCVGASGGSCNASGSGDIAEVVSVPASASVTYTAVCSIDSAATGTLDNTATVTAAAGTTDTNPANDAATDSDTLAPTADLAISKTDNLTTVEVGSTGSYVISVSNAGPSDAPGSSVSDAFPVNFTPGSWTCVSTGGGTCPASGSGDIAANVDLPAAASVAFTVSGSYATDIGTVSNTANVATAASVTDPDASNNAATDTTEIVSPATLSATKVGIANMTVSGGSLNYVIEISNAGPQDQLDNPGSEMVDALPFGYVYLSSTASAGTLSYDPATRTLAWSGPVAVGQTVSISINGSIDPAVAGTMISNQAELRFDADGNGSNEASGLSDDPNQPGNTDPTMIGITAVVPVPGLGLLGMLLLSLAVLTLGWVSGRVR